MKKLTILVSQSNRRDLLMKLRKLGTVHIKDVSTPQADELSSVEGEISNIENAVSLLASYRKGKTGEETRWNTKDARENVNRIIQTASEKKELLRSLKDTEDKIEWFKPWGAFDPEAIKKFEDKGIFVRLYVLTKSAFKKIKSRGDIHIVNKGKDYFYIAQISDDPLDALPYNEVEPLKESYRSLSRKRNTLKRRIEDIDTLLESEARACGFLKEHLSTLKNRQHFLSVMYGMKEEDKFSYLQGFCPVDRVRDLTELARSQEFGYLIEEPDDPSATPTLIRNPKWIRMISPVFKFMNTVPGYNEYDISPWFLLFLSLFFAMLIGDAGYGILFLVITFFAKKKFKKAPKEPFFLMYFLSIMTIAWGAITGTWFGSENILQLPFFNAMVIDRINSFLGTNQNFMIYLCFVIGVIHLSIAHFISAFKIINSPKAISEVGWILVLWGLFFSAGTLVLGRPFPEFAGYLLIVGVAFVLLFSNPQRNIIKGILSSLIDTPLKIISSFADVVSYLRLFAVGYASLVLASTFNHMAMDIGFNTVTRTLGSAFILFFGHALNIILGFMAVIVHGVRLNMLEFSSQLGMEWSGKEYTPFREG